MRDTTPTSPATPPVEASWARIDAWLAEHAPVTYGLLAPPVTEEELAAAQERLRLEFHPDLVASLRCHNGTAQEEGALEPPGLWGAFARLADIVRNSLFLRDIGADVADDFADEEGEEGGEADELSAYWRHEWLLITIGIAWDAQDGLFLTCREGAQRGALGRYFNEDAPGFTRWTSLRQLLAELADALENRRPMEGRVAVVFEDRLLWEEEYAPLCEPRSVLALAEAAGEPAEPERVYTAEVPEQLRRGEGFAFWLRGPGGRPTPPDRPDVVFADGPAPRQLLRLMGVREETLRDRSRRQAKDAAAGTWGAHRPMVRAGACDGWSYAVDEAGPPQGRRPEVLRRVSAGGRAVALWSQGRTVWLSVYEDGEPVCVCGTERGGLVTRSGRPPEALTEALREAGPAGGEQPEDAYERMLKALEGAFGIAFDPVDTELAALPSGLVLPLLDDLTDHERRSTVHDLGLGTVVDGVDEAVLGAALAAQLRRLAAETGLDGYPETADALRRIDAGEGGGGPVADDDPLGIRLRLLNLETHAAQQSHHGHRSWDRRTAKPLVTREEMEAWTHRSTAGRALRGFFLWPSHVAGTAVLHRRRSPDWRAEFLEDLERNSPG